MGTLFGFVVGFIVGARIGSDGFDEVVQAYHDLRNSREFGNFVGVARHHSVQTMQMVMDRLAPQEERLSTIERAKRRAGG